MTKPSVVFFGTGPVAAQSLELLHKNFSIEAVVTKPKPPRHRGSFPVLEVAESLQCPILTASTKHEVSAVVEKAAFSSQLGVLIDFGIIVSRDVIDAFPLGIVNSHFSVLPEWRGPDPITFAVLSGQPTTGVSLMLLVEAMDEGPLIAYGEYDMPAAVTTPELTKHLIHLSDALLAREIPRYLAKGSDFKTADQSVTGRQISYSKMLTKADGQIDWRKSAAELEREIRAYLGWPGSYTTLADIDVTITQAHLVPSQAHESQPGDIQVVPEAKVLMVATGNGSLCIDKLKPAGKREMSARDFLAGYGQRLSQD